MKRVLTAATMPLLIGLAVVALGALMSLIMQSWNVLVNWVTMLGVVVLIVAGAPLFKRDRHRKEMLRRRLRGQADLEDSAEDAASPPGVSATQGQAFRRSMELFLVSLPMLVLPTLLWYLMH